MLHLLINATDLLIRATFFVGMLYCFASYFMDAKSAPATSYIPTVIVSDPWEDELPPSPATSPSVLEFPLPRPELKLLPPATSPTRTFPTKSKLSAMTVKELKKLASDRQIAKAYKLRKAELIEALLLSYKTDTHCTSVARKSSVLACKAA